MREETKERDVSIFCETKDKTDRQTKGTSKEIKKTKKWPRNKENKTRNKEIRRFLFFFSLSKTEMSSQYRGRIREAMLMELLHDAAFMSAMLWVTA